MLTIFFPTQWSIELCIQYIYDRNYYFLNWKLKITLSQTYPEFNQYSFEKRM
jgi:hypothetical protein